MKPLRGLAFRSGRSKTRIDRGRKKLGDALTRRGVAVGIGVLALAVPSPAGASPSRLVEAAFAAAAGEVPATVAALAEGCAVNGLLNKSLVAAIVCAATVGIGVGVVRLPAGQPPAKGLAKPQAAAVPPAAGATVYRGRVLGPDGKPVTGAKLYLTPAMGYLKEPYDAPQRATTGADGRFEFAAPKATAAEPATVVTATAAKLGPAWVQVDRGGKTDDLTLRLVPDEVPITGQILNIEGRPVAGATLRVLQINAACPAKTWPLVLEAAATARAGGPELELEIPRAVHNRPDAEGDDRRRRPFPAHRPRPQPPRPGAARRADHRQPTPPRSDAAGRAHRSDVPGGPGRVRRGGGDDDLLLGRLPDRGRAEPSRSSAWSATGTRRSRSPASRSAA